MSNLFQSINELKSKHEEAKKEFKAKGQEALKIIFDQLFERYPFLKSLNWTQYTPYFNDGDLCEFSVHELEFTLGKNEFELPVSSEDEDYHEDDYGEFMSTYVLFKWSTDWKTKTYINSMAESLSKDLDTLSGILQSTAMEEIMQDIYGDHVRVAVTRDGTDVEEYSHD